MSIRGKWILIAGLIVGGAVQAADPAGQAEVYWKFIDLNIAVERKAPEIGLPEGGFQSFYKRNHLIFIGKSYESKESAGDHIRFDVHCDQTGRLEIRVAENGTEWMCYGGPAAKCNSIRLDFKGEDSVDYILTILLKSGTLGKFR